MRSTVVNNKYVEGDDTSAASPTTTSDMTPFQHFGTLAVHAGQDPDPQTGAVIPALSLSTTFKQTSVGAPIGKYDYSRSGNPTRDAFESAVAALEGGQFGLAFSSGSAVTATLTNMFPAGSHFITVNDVYGGTYRFFNKVAKHQNIAVDFVDLSDPDNIVPYFKPNTKLVWIETPTNPTLRLVDIQRIAKHAHDHGAILVVDNTFLSPYFQRPLALGADIVTHSVTKYINGHSDAVMGVAITNDPALRERIAFLQNSIGAVPSAFDCFLANRGLKTLHLRMRQHQANALAVARFLESQIGKTVDSVIYSGLESHPQHELAKRQQRGYGGMVSFRILGGFAEAERFCQTTQIFTLAESLGGVESLCEIPCKMTHGSVSPEDRARIGITDNLIRLSVGIEDTADLLEDVRKALSVALGAGAGTA